MHGEVKLMGLSSKDLHPSAHFVLAQKKSMSSHQHVGLETAIGVQRLRNRYDASLAAFSTFAG